MVFVYDTLAAGERGSPEDTHHLLPHLLVTVPRVYRRSIDSIDELAGPFIGISQRLGNSGELKLSPHVHATPAYPTNASHGEVEVIVYSHKK